MCVEKKREVLIYALYAHDGSQVGYRPVGGVVLCRRQGRLLHINDGANAPWEK